MKKIGFVLCLVVFMGCSKKGLIPTEVANKRIKKLVDSIKIAHASEMKRLNDRIDSLENQLGEERKTRTIIIKKTVEKDRTDLIEMLKADIDELKEKVDEYE